MAIGCFLPLVNAPIVGQITYVHNGNGEGIIVGILAIVGFFLAIANLTGWTAIPGVLCLGLIGHIFYALTSKIADANATMNQELAGNPFRGLAETITQSGTFGVAWPVLVIGATMLIAANCMHELKWKTATTTPPIEKPKRASFWDDFVVRK